MKLRSYGVLALIAVLLYHFTAVVSACTMPPSSSAEIEIEIEFEDYDGDRDRLLYKMEIEAEVVAPSQLTQCQCGIGLGSTTFIAPPSFDVLTAAVGVRNDNGLEFDLEDFEGFAPDGSVTTVLEGLPGFNTGATAFGLSTEVNPFDLPPLNSGDKLVLGFLFEFAPADFSAVNGTSIQIAAGSNEPGHPLAIFQAVQPTLRLPSFQLHECDVNFDQSCGIDDLNAILALGPIEDGIPRIDSTEVYDLNGDDVIDMEDVDEWLAGAASFNDLAAPYMYGDANLDGDVNATDFDAWNARKFTNSLRWNRGDFTGDGVVDVSDFHLWNEHKGLTSAVPEPSGGLLFVCLLAWFSVARRKRPRPQFS